MEQVHENAYAHVSGRSIYISDMQVEGMLHGKAVYSTQAHAHITAIDVSAAQQYPGVRAVVTASGIRGINNVGSVAKDEPCLAEKECTCIGQAIALVAADTEAIAAAAARLITISYEPLPAILNIEEAIKAGNYIGAPFLQERGDAPGAIAAAKHRLEGCLHTGAQEHWYLETQMALAIPGEGDEITIHSATQNPTETQLTVAHVLNINVHDVVVENRRIGGAFGGKESQASRFAAWAALLAQATKSPVHLRLSRTEDQTTTGKRHPYRLDYRAAYTEEGKITAIDIDCYSDCGNATDLSPQIMERSMFHIENSYYIPHIRFNGRLCLTNTPSNTAFRGFGAPQAIAVIELILSRIATALQKDEADIKSLNLFSSKGQQNISYTGQDNGPHRLPQIMAQLLQASDYRQRREQIKTFNAAHNYIKRGMGVVPVRFGISFTTSFLNQAGALVILYKDGSLQVNHGGVEMGQGLNTKIRQIAVHELGIDFEAVRVMPTNTSRVPNTSPTAASTGTDLNGMAVKNAIDILKARLAPVAAKRLNCSTDDILFRNNGAENKNNGLHIAFPELAQQAVLQMVGLSVAGYYHTPGIWFDKEKHIGHPFHYYTYGIALSEVEVDLFTGHSRVLRADILHDGGCPINKAIDKGQIEGAYVQGLGWCITEDIKVNNEGRLLNVSPDTYKIPTIADIPLEFNVILLDDTPNPSAIMNSKAVGEPPFLYGLSAWLAIRDALVAATGGKDIEVNIPMHNEAILLALAKYQKDK